MSKNDMDVCMFAEEAFEVQYLYRTYRSNNNKYNIEITKMSISTNNVTINITVASLKIGSIFNVI